MELSKSLCWQASRTAYEQKARVNFTDLLENITTKDKRPYAYNQLKKDMPKDSHVLLLLCLRTFAETSTIIPWYQV